MFEIINGFIGIGFAWVMMALMLMPAAVMAEYLMVRYVSYASDDIVTMPTIITSFWDKWFKITGDTSFSNRCGADGMQAIFFIAIWVVPFIVSLVEFRRNDPSVMEYLTFVFFDIWVIFGNIIAPVLLLVGLVLAFTYVSRNGFKLQRVITDHIKDKKIHK